MDEIRNSLAERHKSLGLIAIEGQEFQTNEPKRLSEEERQAAHNLIRWAKIPKTQVNSERFDGELTVDGYLMTLEDLLKAIKTSARAYKWTKGDLTGLLKTVKETNKK